MVNYEKYEQQYRQSAQEHVSEPVENAWLFYRTGGMASLGLAHVTPAGASIANAIGKKRAGGFPNQFMLVVTPTKVHAFKAKTRYTSTKVGKEVAVWERAGLRVSAEDAALNTKVTIESEAEGEKVVCSTGKDAASLRAIEALQRPVVAA